MVSSDKLSKLVALPTAIPAVLVALLLLSQWRSTACSFEATAPDSGLLICRQRLLGWQLQNALVKVERREGWLWGRKQVGLGLLPFFPSELGRTSSRTRRQRPTL